MSLGPQLKKSAYCQNRHKNLCAFQEKDKTSTNELKKVSGKLNQKNTLKKLFHCSEESNKNLSHHNFDVTKKSSASPTQVAAINNKTLKKCNNRCIQSQQSMTIPHSKIFSENCHAYTKKRCNYEFTEQRFNYERMKQQLHKQQLNSLPLEKELRCSVSNSTIPTCFDYINEHNPQNIKNVEFGDAMLAKFIALSKFRIQNCKDCFSNSNHPITNSGAQAPHNHIIKTSAKTLTTTATNKLNWSIKEIESGNKNILLTSMPYALRQRLLRDQLANEFPYRKSKILVSDKSSALSYHLKY